MKLYFSIDSCIADILETNTSIIFERVRVFISELKSLVKPNLKLYIGGYYLIWNDICEVLDNVIGVYSVHISICQLDQLR